MGPRPHLWLWAHITACLAQESKDYMDSSPHVWFCACKSATLAHELIVSVDPSSHLWFLHAKQRLLYEHTGLYGFQTSTVASCIQNSVTSTRITSFYGFQHSSEVFACKTATLGPDLKVCMGPRPHLWFLHAKQRRLDQTYKSLWVLDLTCHLGHTKQRDLHQSDKSIWVPALICVFFRAKPRLLDQT